MEERAGHGLPSPRLAPSEPGTGLLDLPDHLVGLVFAQLKDGRSRRAFYSSCSALRESQAINDLLSLKALNSRLHIADIDQDVAKLLQLLSSWPQFSSLRALKLGSTASGLQTLARALQQATQAAERLRGLAELELLLTGSLQQESGLVSVLQSISSISPSLCKLRLLNLTIAANSALAGGGTTDDTSISDLPLAATLTCLELPFCSLGGPEDAQDLVRHISCLAALQQLQLGLSCCAFVGGCCLDMGPFVNLKQLRWLELQTTESGSILPPGLHTAGLRALAAGCTALTHLTLTGARGVAAPPAPWAAAWSAGGGARLAASAAAGAAGSGAGSGATGSCRGARTAAGAAAAAAGGGAGAAAGTTSGGGAGVPDQVAWPRLAHLELHALEPESALCLLQHAFQDTPALTHAALSLDLLPDFPATGRLRALRSLCLHMATHLACPLARLALRWEDPAEGPPALQVLQALQPLGSGKSGVKSSSNNNSGSIGSGHSSRGSGISNSRSSGPHKGGGLVARLALHTTLDKGDIAALATALPHLQELDLGGCEGPAGSLALEAVSGLHGLRALAMPRPWLWEREVHPQMAAFLSACCLREGAACWEGSAVAAAAAASALSTPMTAAAAVATAAATTAELPAAAAVGAAAAAPADGPSLGTFSSLAEQLPAALRLVAPEGCEGGAGAGEAGASAAGAGVVAKQVGGACAREAGGGLEHAHFRQLQPLPLVITVPNKAAGLAARWAQHWGQQQQQQQDQGQRQQHGGAAEPHWVRIVRPGQ